MPSKKFLRAEQALLAWDAPGLVAGVDEAGRGPLAGPVVAAAVIVTVVALAAVVFPGAVAVVELPAEPAAELRTATGRLLATGTGTPSRWGYDTEALIGPSHRCGPGEYSFDGSHLLRRDIEARPEAYRYLDTRLDGERAACDEVARANAAVAGPVVAATLVLAGVALAVGLGAGWFTVTRVFELPFAPDAGAIAGTLAAATAMTMAVGVLGNLATLGVRPAEALRAD